MPSLFADYVYFHCCTTVELISMCKNTHVHDATLLQHNSVPPTWQR